MHSKLALLPAALALLALPAVAQTLVAPNGYAATEGGGGNTFPWSRATASMRIQFVHDSTNFTLQGVVSPIIVSRLRYRPDAGATTISWAGGSWPNVRIDMATCPVDFLGVQTTFASNLGPDLATVHNGPVTVQAGAGLGAGVPLPFYIDIPLATPFLYDPTTGNDLTIDIYLDGTGWTGTSRSADHVTTAATGALGSRIYNSSATALTSPTGTITTNYSPVVEFTYTPAAGLFAAFSATPTSGTSPLAVQFTDSSFSSAPGGITSWAWDFDGDSVTDSTLQNPNHVYTACGTYTVSLTVTDGTHPQATETKVGHIVVDQISADFTASTVGGFAPVNVQFTDTSTGPVAAWSWDLDGDNVPDSNLQNPAFVYAVPGNYTVSLTVTNSCRTSTRTRTSLITVLAPGTVPAPPEILQYQFNEVRGQSVANTATTNAMPSHGLVNTANWQADPGRPDFNGNEAGFGCLGDSNNTTNANLVSTTAALVYSGSMTFSWWQRLVLVPPSTSYSFGGTGTGRIFTGGVAGTSLTYRGTPSGDMNATYNVQSNLGVWEHVCLVIDDAAGTGTWYFNGTQNSVTNFTPNTHTISHPLATVGYNGTATTTNYTRNYDMDDFRIYSRALLPAEVLLTSVLAEHASAGSSGSFCDGPGGTPVISGGGGRPTVGNLGFSVDLSNAENGCLAAIVFGLTPVAAGVLNLSPWIGAGCELQTDALSLNFMVTAANGATQSFVIPNTNAVAGLHVYGQWLVLGTQGAATRLLDINIQ